MRPRCRVVQGDARDLSLASESVHLVVTSPPYNLGVDYDGHDDSLDEDAYVDLLGDAFAEAFRALVPGGRLAVVVGLGASVPIDDKPGLASTAARSAGFHLRDKFVWYKGDSESSSAWGSWRSPSNPRQIFQHEEILVFYKHQPGRDHRAGQTMTKQEFMQDVKSVWEVKPDSASRHPAAFPREIPRRLIHLYSFPEDVVVDPFCGSGTTCLVADRMGRYFVGVDTSEKYVGWARERIGPVAHPDQRQIG